MSFLPLTGYETASPEVKREYDDQIAKNGRVTNMKRTLLHNVPAYRAYMEWYTLRDELLRFIGERAVSLYAYAISAQSDCLICSAFFRKILLEAGDDPDNPVLSAEEKLLMDFGRALSRNPHTIDESLYRALQSRFSTEQIVVLIAFGGIMAATNLFNTAAKIPLDEVLSQYVKQGGAQHG